MAWVDIVFECCTVVVSLRRGDEAGMKEAVSQLSTEAG